MTYAPPTVTAPAPLPWDLPAISAAALAVLRLEAGDVDEARIEGATVVACQLVDAEIDAVVAPLDVGPVVEDAAVTLTVELYRRKDAPFGVTDSWSLDGAVLRLSSDVMRGVRSQLAPYVQRRGIA